jgi:hypothetical protein
MKIFFMQQQYSTHLKARPPLFTDAGQTLGFELDELAMLIFGG